MQLARTAVGSSRANSSIAPPSSSTDVPDVPDVDAVGDPELFFQQLNAFCERGEELVRVIDDELAAAAIADSASESEHPSRLFFRGPIREVSFRKKTQEGAAWRASCAKKAKESLQACI